MSPCWGSQFMGGLRNAKKKCKTKAGDDIGEMAEDRHLV